MAKIISSSVFTVYIDPYIILIGLCEPEFVSNYLCFVAVIFLMLEHSMCMCVCTECVLTSKMDWIGERTSVQARE